MAQEETMSLGRRCVTACRTARTCGLSDVNDKTVMGGRPWTAVCFLCEIEVKKVCTGTVLGYREGTEIGGEGGQAMNAGVLQVAAAERREEPISGPEPDQRCRVKRSRTDELSTPGRDTHDWMVSDSG